MHIESRRQLDKQTLFFFLDVYFFFPLRLLSFCVLLAQRPHAREQEGRVHHIRANHFYQHERLITHKKKTAHDEDD